MPIFVDFVVFILFVIFFSRVCEIYQKEDSEMCILYFLFYLFENKLIFLCRSTILIKIKESPYPSHDCPASFLHH